MCFTMHAYTHIATRRIPAGQLTLSVQGESHVPAQLGKGMPGAETEGGEGLRETSTHPVRSRLPSTPPLSGKFFKENLPKVPNSCLRCRGELKVE